jgi:tetratricopeptide (TPR) repeat protein
MPASPSLRRRLSTTAGALAVALFTACATAQVDDIQEVAKLMRAGQHAQAMERVNRILSAKPRDAQARFLKGLIFAEQGNAKEAIAMFQKLTEDFPELPEPYNNLAVIYASQGQYDKARSALEQSIRTHPSYATAYENLGDVYAKLASQAYDKALQLDSANSVAQNKLSMVRDLVGGTKPPVKPAVVVAQKEPAKPEPAKVEPAKPEPAKAEPAKPPVVAAVEPKPAAEKPAAAKPAVPDANAEVLQAVNAWAAAWSQKNVDGYLAAYAKDFKTPGGEARADWEKGRRQRIEAPKSISVSVEAPKVTVTGDQATVSFRQNYRSDLVKSGGGKTLVMAKVGGKWLIQQEKVN